jgi:tryptophan-rich sensory protein
MIIVRHEEIFKDKCTTVTSVAAFAATGITAISNADVSVYTTLAKPALAASTMKLDLIRTAIVIINSKVDF